MQCPNCGSKCIARSGKQIVDIHETTDEYGELSDYDVGDWDGYTGTAKCSCLDCATEWEAAGEYVALRSTADNPWQTQWPTLFPTDYDPERNIWRIETPLTYPTGGTRICVYIRRRDRDRFGNEFVLTDLGKTGEYLAGLGYDISECRHNLQMGVGLDDGELILRFLGEDWLAWNVLRLAQVIDEMTMYLAGRVFGGELHIPEQTG